MFARNVKRLLLVVGLALLLPGVAAAGGAGPAERSFWEEWANPVELAARFWESLGDLTGLWNNGGSIDPNGLDTNGAGACVGSECGGAIDPNG